MRNRKNPLKATESDEQIALFELAKTMISRFPELRLLHAIPNGGLRNKITASRMRREGVKPGVPDIFLPVARGKYHGMYIELKTISGRLSNLQIAWIGALTDQGYDATVCYGADQAIDQIIKYLCIEGK